MATFVAPGWLKKSSTTATSSPQLYYPVHVSWALKVAIVNSFKFICTHSMHVMMISVWSLPVIAHCAL